jgi:hypothetical protein
VLHVCMTSRETHHGIMVPHDRHGLLANLLFPRYAGLSFIVYFFPLECHTGYAIVTQFFNTVVLRSTDMNVFDPHFYHNQHTENETKYCFVYRLMALVCLFLLFRYLREDFSFILSV